MNRRTLVGVGVAIALLGLVAWWRLVGRGDDARTGTKTTGRGTGSAVASGGSTAATKRGPVVPASVSGRITQRSGGAGIASARVSLARAKLGADFLDAGDAPTIQTVTDAQGAWTASNVTPGVYVLAAVAKGFIPGTRDTLLVASGERKTGIDLALAAGGVILSGTISDVGGGPIAGAEVTVTREQGMSLHGGAELIALAGDDGRYELTLADGDYSAVASHADYTSESRGFELTGTPHTLDFTLTPGASIRGKVVTRDGTPLAGAFVQADAGGGRGRGRDRDSSTTATDDQGTFKLRSLDAGARSLKASGRGYASSAPTVVEVGIGEQVDGVTIIVDRAYSISGNVFEKGTKKGVAGVRLGVFSMGGDTAFAFTPTEADGAFEIVGLKPGSYMMFAIGDEVMPEIGKPIEVVDKDVTDVVVEMASGVSVSGRVDPPGVASIGIAPTVVGIGNIFEAMKSMMVKAESDATGAFTLKHVPSGSFNITARTKDGRAGKVLVIVEAVDKTGVVVPLEKRGSLAGRVVDVRGAPVASVSVMAVAMKGESESSLDISFDMDSHAVRTGADGAFKIVGLDAGKVGLRVSDDSGVLRWADAAHKDKPRESIEFDIARGADRTGITLTVETLDGVIRGTVTGVDRKPTADVWITATLTEKRDMTRGEVNKDGDYDGGQPSSKPVLTGPDGTFVIERLRKGTYQIVAESARGTARAEKPDVKTGDSVTLVLAPLGTLTGKVTASGSPVAEYDLLCKPLKNEEDIETRRVTDATGVYKLERLAPGEYACSAAADAGRASGKVAVPSGEATLDLVLDPWATVTGTVVSALSGAPVPGVKLMIGGDGFDPKQIADMLQGGGPTSDARGVFTLSRIPPGKNELLVMSKDGGFAPLAKRDFTTTSGQRLDLGTIKIVPPRTGEAGTLGMGTEIAEAILVVTSVKPGGPAEGAGVQVGDKIMSINGVAVAEVTPLIAQTLLASGTVGVGQQFQLGLDRGGTAAQVTILAVAW